MDSDVTQQRQPPDRQPFGDENVAAVKKDRRVWGDELAWSELLSGLFAPRSDFPVSGFAVAKLRHHFIVAVQNADLTVQVRANHPFVFRVKVTRHSEARIVLDRL